MMEIYLLRCVSLLLAHRDRFSYNDLTSAFGAKRKWAARQGPLPRSKVTHNVISLPSIDALRKAYSITSSAVA